MNYTFRSDPIWVIGYEEGYEIGRGDAHVDEYKDVIPDCILAPPMAKRWIDGYLTGYEEGYADALDEEDDSTEDEEDDSTEDEAPI